MSRQTTTYKLLSQLMYGHPASGVLSEILGRIHHYCQQNELPKLNAIVVNQETGLPGDDIPMNVADTNAEREKVYRMQDWYSIVVPRKEQLAAAWKIANP